MTDLFTIPPQLSPRLQWIKEHGIITLMEPGQDGNQWVAFVASYGRNNACGATEDEAIVNLAKHLNLRLWNGA